VFFTLGGAEGKRERAQDRASSSPAGLKNIARYRSYHGASMGALSLTGDWRRLPLEPGLPGVIHVDDCYCDRCPFQLELATCKRECATNIGDRDAAAKGRAASPPCSSSRCPGANGVLVPPPEYWPLVRAACDPSTAPARRRRSADRLRPHR
jgi:taurine--2-oxoglutarate transaminase